MAVSLVALLQAGARRHPERPAVAAPGGRLLTYRELDRSSGGVAAALGTRRGERVGLLLPKSVESVVGVWAAMRTGAAYVPIDPTAPPQRAAYIAANCEMSALLVSGDLTEAVVAVREAVPGARLLQIHGDETAVAGLVRIDPFAAPAAGEPPPPSPVNVRDLAYILYTSGSTGVPKGVMVSHGAALAFVEWAADTFALTTADVVSSHAPLHFDLSTFDLFGAAAAAAQVVVLTEETVRFPMRSADVLEQERISVWYSVPGALRRMLRSGGLAGRDLGALRVVLFAGEPYPADEVRQLQDALPSGVRLANLYGPTETNVCTWWEVPPPGWTHAQLPIGSDCTSCEGVVVGEDLSPVPHGTTGELLVRGGTLMTGYWGDPDRTERSFVPDFLHPHLGDRLYRTGDLVRRTPEGAYEFHGRRDSMVKVRGYRIELGEVEAALLRAEGVREAAVVAVGRMGTGLEGEMELVAFVAGPDGAAAGVAESRRLLGDVARVLPKYMLPSDIRWLPKLPLTSSGKTDRQHLLRMAGVNRER